MPQPRVIPQAAFVLTLATGNYPPAQPTAKSGSRRALTGREPLDRESEGLTLKGPAQGGQAFPCYGGPDARVSAWRGFLFFPRADVS